MNEAQVYYTLCFLSYRFNERRFVFLRREEDKEIGKTLFRAIVDCFMESVLEWLATAVDLEWILKVSIFVLIVRCCYQLVGCLLIVFFIVWLLI